MKTKSIWKIEFVPTGAESGTVLLDYGDLMDSEPSLGCEQEAQTQSAVNAIWSRSFGLGGVQRPLSWSRQVNHASPIAAREFCIIHGTSMPHLQQGALRYTVEGGNTWEIRDAVVISAQPEPLHGIPHATITRYIGRGGKTRPISVIALFDGITPAWINSLPEDIAVSPESLAL